MIVWTEAGQSSGVGHLFRSIALAQEAVDRGIEVYFVLDEEAARIARRQHEWDFQIIELDRGFEIGNKTEIIRSLNAQILVLDGYNLPVTQASLLAKIVRCIVVMDDGETRLLELADIVINPATDTLDDVYLAANPDVVTCTGASYRLLRKSFTHIIPEPIHRRYGIAICFGGSDPSGMTLTLLETLDLFPDAWSIPVRVVTGPAFKNVAQVEALCQRVRYPTQHIHQCQDMASVWGTARLAISAAGGSQFELGVCQTPSILIVVADNQLQASKTAQGEGWCHVCNSEDSAVEIVQQLLALYKDDVLLGNMHTAAKHLYDASGAYRAMDAIVGVINDNRPAQHG